MSQSRRPLLLALLATLTLSGPARADAPAGPAEAKAPSQEAGPTSGFHKGFFIASEDGAYKLQVGALLMARYTYESLDGPSDRTDVSNFSIPRARLILKGNAFTKSLTYKLQADFGKGGAALKDLYLDYAFIPHVLQLRAGQWKRPFSRQLITSASKLELVDRALTDSAFGAGRDIGVALHNDYESSPGFEWALGVFNGTGEKGHLSGSVEVDPATGEGSITSGKFNNVPDMFNPTLVARVGLNHGGIKGYSEADLEGGPFRIAVGGSVLVDFDADGNDQSSVKGEVDTIMKVEGFDLSAAGYVASIQDGTDFGDRKLEALGFHAQTGYVIAGRVQPTFRYTLVAPDGDDNDVQVFEGGVAVYVFDHSFKWVTDFAGILSQDPGPDRTDYRVRSQAQLSF